MNKYFCKYLPVEGEIKEGDHFDANGKIYTFFGFDKAKSSVNTVETEFIYHSATNNAQEWLNKHKKVKLFLCSRDNTEYRQEILTEGIKKGQEFSEEEKDFLTLM